MPSTNRNSNWYHRRQGAIDRRRLEVARLMLKGFSQREITAELEAMGCVNPDSRKPYSLMAINVDCKRLTQEWRERVAEDVDDILGQQLAEIREARRAAWAAKDLNAVYRGMELEVKLLGTAAPEKREITVKDIDTAIERELENLAAASKASHAAALADDESDDGDEQRLSGVSDALST